MKKQFALLLLLLTVSTLVVSAQVTDSLSRRSLIKHSILSTVLIGSGVLINNSKFEKRLKTDIRNRVGNNYHFPIDDYIQYAPVATMYLADIFKVKSRNHWFDQTKYLFISQVLTSSITHSLKIWTDKTRPNGGDLSFPSGHTTFAFTNATVLANEFRDTAPWISYTGYGMAVTTGAFRMINNKHWFSDVLVGAGIGIIVTEAVYYFEPFKNFNPFKKIEQVMLLPQVSGDQVGLYFSYNF